MKAPAPLSWNYVSSALPWLLALLVATTSYATSQVWQLSNNGLPTGQTPTSLSFDVNAVLLSYADGSLYRSVEAGSAWTIAPNLNMIEQPRISSVALSRNRWWVVGADGLLMTEDNGVNWRLTQSLPLRVDFSFPASVIASMDTIVLVTNGAVLRSTNEGLDWQVLAAGSVCRSASVGVVASGVLLVGSGFGSVLRQQANELELVKVGEIPWKINEFVAHQDVLLTATDGGVYISRDLGSTWLRSTLTLQANSIASFGTLLFVATNEGVFKSEDNAVTWTNASTGMGEINVSFIRNYYGVLIAVDALGRAFQSRDPSSVINAASEWPEIQVLSGSINGNINIRANGLVLVVDIRGNVVAEANCRPNDQLLVDMSEMASGVYIIVETGSQPKSSMFLWTR